MPSVILTAINTIKPKNFNHQIEIMSGKNSDWDFLLSFVKHIHRGQKTTKFMVEHYSSVRAYTNKASYSYKIYQHHIVKTNLENLKKTFYKIN